MPVRSKAVEWLTRRVLPGVWFTFGEPSDPRWPEEFERADEMYVALVQVIDWQRVLLEAMGRHLAFDHDDDAAAGTLRDQPCGECVREALLATDHDPNWREQASAARLGKPRERA